MTDFGWRWLLGLLYCCIVVVQFLMSGKNKSSGSPASRLQLTVLHDTLGEYITVTCGSLSGNLYLSKLDESNKSQSKCVVVSGKWYRV